MLKKIRKKIMNSIFQSGTGNLAIFKSKNITVNNVQALDQLREYISKGELTQAALLISQMNGFINSQHPGAPYYKYEFSINNKGQHVISHVPAFPGAEKLKPLEGSFKFRLPENYKQYKNLRDLLNYSYGMQQEIELDLESFKTWIGETILEEFSSNGTNTLKIKMIPEEFPPPSAMKLYTKDNSWSIDYLLVGVKEINNNRIVFDNSKQSNAPFSVMFDVDLATLNANFDISISDSALNSVQHILKFKELVLISDHNTKPNLALKLLEQDADFIVGRHWKFDEKNSGDTKEFVDFLHKLHEIEQHFGINFIIPNKIINGSEISLTELIFNSIHREYYKTDFTGGNYVFYLHNEADIEKLFIFDTENPTGFNINLGSLNPQSFELFGVKFNVGIHNLFIENIKLADPSKLRKINQLREINESLKIKIVPTGKNSHFNEMMEVNCIV